MFTINNGSKTKRILTDLTGKQFGRLLVLRLDQEATFKHKHQKTVWVCQCSCPNKTITSVVGNSLSSGLTTSCGCWRTEVSRKNGKKRDSSTHGESNKPQILEYDAWRAMKRRCYGVNSLGYSYYGAKGITVCDRWIGSYENFLQDMGRKPSPEHSLDRIDNDGNYEPTNCRWATKAQQARNSSNCVLNEGMAAEIRELFKTMSAREISEKLNVSNSAVNNVLCGKTWA